jgi:hypothetical protein
VGGGQEVEQPVLGEQPGGPVRVRAGPRSEPAKHGGHAGDLGVHHPGGQLSLSRALAAARGGRGQAGRDLVAQPGLQLGQAGGHPFGALRGPAVRGGLVPELSGGHAATLPAAGDNPRAVNPRLSSTGRLANFRQR